MAVPTTSSHETSQNRGLVGIGLGDAGRQPHGGRKRRLVSRRHSRARSAGEFIVCRPICVTRGHVPPSSSSSTSSPETNNRDREIIARRCSLLPGAVSR